MSIRTRRVLVVDDDPDSRELFATVLASAGADVTKAADGFTALKEAAVRLPDLVISDVAMPRMDGVELARRLREQEHTRDVPVVIVTGEPTGDLLARLRVLGCAAVMSKPCSPDSLVGTLNRQIGRRSEDRSDHSESALPRPEQERRR